MCVCFNGSVISSVLSSLSLPFPPPPNLRIPQILPLPLRIHQRTLTKVLQHAPQNILRADVYLLGFHRTELNQLFVMFLLP